MRSRRAIVLVSGAAMTAAASADVVLEQIGPAGANLISNGFVTGYFNHYSTPPVSWGNRGVLDDFLLTQRMRLTRIEAAVSSNPGEPINWANILGWRVEIYSNPQVALNNDLRGDMLHLEVTTATQFTIPYTPFPFGPSQIALAAFDVDVTLDPARYWVAVIPVNRVGNGYGAIIASSVGNAFNPWQVLPGNTVFPLQDPGIGFRIMGTPAGSCYPNCDGSTIAPVLNVNDFICFQSRFAAGDPYANCDQSTEPPILNVNDFVCFQSAFAAGCQ